MERCSPATSALFTLTGTLIFSFCATADIGSCSLTEDLTASNVFFRWARCFSRLAAILNVQLRRRINGKKSMDIPVLEEGPLSACFDFSDSLHGLDRCLDQLPVISHWHISTFLEVDCRVLENSCVKPWKRRVVSLTMVISLPAAFLKAFVHLTFRGLRFILQDKMLFRERELYIRYGD